MPSKVAKICLCLGIVLFLVLLITAAKSEFSVTRVPYYLNNSDADYYLIIQNFSLAPLNSTDCTKLVDPIFYKLPTGIGNNCSYWDKRLLDYYAACVTYEGIVPDLGVTVKDDCGAMSVPVKLK